MKDVIDVLQLQREKARKVPPVNYQEKSNNYLGVRFIFECGKYAFTINIYMQFTQILTIFDLN